ncbi:MAG: tripartite tricarboxylate transporter substrate binding protein [Qingshengfaniella sp.]
MNRFAGLAALAALCVATSPAFAEFPERDIRVIVPWGAGGGADAIGRKIMSIAERELPVSIYVENLEGGVTSIGVNALMAAPADGYTVGALTYDSVVTVPWEKILPGYSLDRLDMLALVTSEPNALMVGRGTYDTFDEVIAAAKAAPGEIKVGIQGLGSMTHISLLQLEDAMDVKFRTVTYPGGSGAQREAILSGEVEAVVTSLGDFAPLLSSGDAKGLVEFSDARNQGFPDVPISADFGLDLVNGSFMLFAVPAGTPAAAADLLASAIETAWKSDEFQDWTAQVGVAASWMNAEDVTAFTRQYQSDIFGILTDLTERGVIE